MNEFSEREREGVGRDWGDHKLQYPWSEENLRFSDSMDLPQLIEVIQIIFTKIKCAIDKKE